MIDDIWLIVLMIVGIVGICGAVFVFWWIYFMPEYINRRIKGIITEHTRKSCFNCEHFSERYQDGWLWCSEIGLNLYKVQNKCRIWKLRSFGELDVHNDALHAIEHWVADNYRIVNGTAPDSGSVVIDVLDLLDVIDKTRVQKGLAIPEDTPVGRTNDSKSTG